MATQEIPDPSRCPACGQSNQCTLANPATATRPCWCFNVTISAEALANPLASANQTACLCPNCAQARTTENPNAT